jgi:hypothetical protein
MVELGGKQRQRLVRNDGRDSQQKAEQEGGTKNHEVVHEEIDDARAHARPKANAHYRPRFPGIPSKRGHKRWLKRAWRWRRHDSLLSMQPTPSQCQSLLETGTRTGTTDPIT